LTGQCAFLVQVNIKVPPKDDSDLEVMKSGRYYIILLGKSISVTWDLAMGVSVILKGNFKVSGFSFTSYSH